MLHSGLHTSENLRDPDLRMRVCAVSFLNTVPFWGMLKGPQQGLIVSFRGSVRVRRPSGQRFRRYRDCSLRQSTAVELDFFPETGIACPRIGPQSLGIEKADLENPVPLSLST